MARAYLELMRRHGYRPATIVRMVPRPGMIIGLLPRSVRGRMLAIRNETLANHWPRVLADRFPGLYRDMVRKIESSFELGAGFIDALRDGRDIEIYGEIVRDLEVSNLKDPRLVDALAEQCGTPILFTGGGILPASIFEIPGIRLLHIHPGFLPYIRGADGLLWSTLIRGRPGVSAFIMAPGLDLGAVIAAHEVEPLVFDVPLNEEPDGRDLYRMVFSFYDPILRLHALRSLLPKLASGEPLRAASQDESIGRTFHFMDRRLRDRALGRLFQRERVLPLQ